MVCCGEDGDAFQGFDTIHLVQEGGEDIDAVVATTLTLTSNRLDFVEEDDTWACCSCSSEDVSDCSLGFTDIHVEEFGSFDGEEVEADFSCHCLCTEGLGAAGGSVEEDTFGWRDTYSVYSLGMLQKLVLIKTVRWKRDTYNQRCLDS